MKNTRPGLEAIEQGRYQAKGLVLKIKPAEAPKFPHDPDDCLCSDCVSARFLAFKGGK